MNHTYSLKSRLADGFLSLFGFKAGSNSSRTARIIYEGYIAGYQYHQGTQLEDKFVPGTSFSLKHEPENPFDDDAIAVYYGEAKIGFIPAHTNVEIARMMRQGTPLKARVARYEPNLEPWERVQVEVLDERDEAR